MEGGKKKIEPGQLVGVARGVNLDADRTVYSLQHSYNKHGEYLDDGGGIVLLLYIPLFIVLVPFEIHQSSGILTISSTADLREWKSSYNLEVVASDSSQKISTPVTIHITKDAQDDATIEKFADKLNDLPEVLEYSVQENVEGNGNTRDVLDL